MSNKLLFSLLSLLVFAGCSSEGRRLRTESGFDYEIVRKGTDETIPANSYVFFHMSLMSNDSVLQTTATKGEPSILKLMDDNKNYGQLQPLIDLIATLHKGDSLAFYFPLDSFDSKPPNFEKLTGPLVYHVGIEDFMNEADFQVYTDSMQKAQEAVRQVVRDRLPDVESKANATLASVKKGELNDQIKTTDTGLRYIVHEEGDGPKPEKGEQVTVHYYGMLDADGKMFDTSFKMGQPYQFPLGVGQVIPGWDEGLLLLNKGSKATLLIPATLGYGAAGSPPVIPADADLVFYVELEK